MVVIEIIKNNGDLRVGQTYPVSINIAEILKSKGVAIIQGEEKPIEKKVNVKRNSNK